VDCASGTVGGGLLGGVNGCGNIACLDDLFGPPSSTEAVVDTEVKDPARPLCSGEPIEVLVRVGLVGGGVVASSIGQVPIPKFPAILPFAISCLYTTTLSLEGFGPFETEVLRCGGGCRGDRESSDMTGVCRLVSA
jgi:hypothetical protein